MPDFLHTIESYLRYFVEFCTIILELLGVAILVFTALKCFLEWIRHDTKVRLDLAKGIAISLEFKMGSEVLRTVVVREWEELGILGAVIILRGLLTFLIHWEIKHEEKSLHLKETTLPTEFSNQKQQ
ncbi:MAG: DUF1622 domain-containing protein [Lachnospiraceae bacterium]|nr:DUF1622 domain-containing protein [Lachnospiraceae bacterium]